MCRGCHHPQRASMVPGLSLEYRDDPFLKKQRGIEPEIFSFQPVAVVKRRGSIGGRSPGRRRAVKVLYPAQVRKYLPPEKKDWVKRMFFLFLAIVLLQVYEATEGNEELAAPAAPGDVTPLLPTNRSALVLPNLPISGAGASSAVGIPRVRIAGSIVHVCRRNGSSLHQGIARDLPDRRCVVLGLREVKSGDGLKSSSLAR
ncbi:radiation-inducible immediate-early gene IEX-1-like [Hypanus sabinus]|uniref:radiation-inducible immediate-early gene IEX-1-like n=1 Tax=Hypanus sabinus TaxID=79690 RepID=UPI0028C3C777|nr:radiation-inducible immediate-early gene IEX-1-like [Hypanus sabinus]